MPSSKPTKVVRDSGTGRFVPKSKAVTNPGTTVTETVIRKKK